MALLTPLLLLMISLRLGTCLADQLRPEELAQLRPFANTNNTVEVTKKDVHMYYLWASWCPDCRQKLRSEIPGLEREYPGVTLQTVNMDRRVEKATHFIVDEKIKMPVLRDESKLLTKKLKLFSVPAWVVVKKEGSHWKVMGKSMGFNIKEIRKTLALATEVRKRK